MNDDRHTEKHEEHISRIRFHSKMVKMVRPTASATAVALLVGAIASGYASAFAPPMSHHVRASPAATATQIQMQNLLGGIFGGGGDASEKAVAKPNIPDVVVDPDYNVAIGFAAYGIFLVAIFQASLLGVVLGGLTLLFASFLVVQTNRLRFVFDETSFELKSGLSGELTDTGENVVVGGANRRTYASFKNWDFFPSKDFPILVYFKETQTSADKWEEGPGQFDKVGGGQIHFFPAIAKVDQLEEQFRLRGCAKIDE